MSYREQWQEYRQRSRIYWLAIIAVNILALGIGLPLVITLHNVVLFYVYLFVLAGAGVTLNVIGYYRSFWKCPRCHEPFFRKRRWRHSLMYPIFARHCQNCGLPKWAITDDGVERLE